MQYKTRQYHKDPATWILPLKFACSFSDALLRSCDGAMGVKGVYWNKVHQIVARISDEKLRKSLPNQLIGLATTEISKIKSAVKKLKKQARETDPDVASAMSASETKFSSTTLLWHDSNCCPIEAVSMDYTAQKRRKYQLFRDDCGVIRFIQQHYRETTKK